MGVLSDAMSEIKMSRRRKREREAQTEASRLAGSAYMGDEGAMEELMRDDPLTGIKTQGAMDTRSQEKRQRFIKESQDLGAGIAKFEDLESAQGFAAPRIADLVKRYPEMAEELGIDDVFDEGDFAEAKALFGEQAESAFAGTSMDAQVSNMLSKGVDDAEFRSSPEYARAWQLASEPKVIRTPTGDITLRPELSAIFKAPGEADTKPADIKKAVKKDVELIPGTEKELKTTADEKLSFGFYSRMVEDENNIKALGDFDSRSTWERLKGLTNITASPELQKYRQAADDWTRAKLRRESGAVIAQDEMDKEYKIYFPQIGDSQAVIDQKKKSRMTAQNAMKIASGVEFKKQQKAKKGDLQKRAAELEKELGL